MPYYRFGWIQNAVETSWWIENLQNDDDAAVRADEIMDHEDEQLQDVDTSELPAQLGGVVWEPATEEEIRTALASAEREDESVPLIPPEELIF